FTKETKYLVMLADARLLKTLLPEELDDYLARGWFRMGQTIFTTNFLNFNNQLFGAIWLRIPLSDYSPDKKQLSLQRLNKNFRKEIVPLAISLEHELLFEKYKTHIPFETSPSLHQLLFDQEPSNAFDTQMINIYDKDKLIACGIFDLGKTSAEGISCIYDPDYKKYSLGKYLIASKLEFCAEKNLEYFYPGYFVPGYPAFDYKLGIQKDKLQYLDLSCNQWLPLHTFQLSNSPIYMMVEKLNILQYYFFQNNIVTTIRVYPFFDCNIVSLYRGAGYFDFPIILVPNDYLDNPNSFFIYDIRDKQYHQIEYTIAIDLDQLKTTDDIITSKVLQAKNKLFSTDEVEEIIARQIQFIQTIEN
ncbi:MAG: hypothetical protein K2Q22_12545, partial [Cytophagales bacterium]|nr:hypothetical protein [Cytophagales bacterium]